MRVVWVKEMNPPEISCIIFLHYNSIGILLRGETSWKKFFVSMDYFPTLLFHRNSSKGETSWKFFFVSMTTMSCIEPLQRIPVFFMRYNQTTAKFMCFQFLQDSTCHDTILLCFTVPASQRGQDSYRKNFWCHLEQRNCYPAFL